tara:strand:+ start:227 stop:1591 length:1365 start_codon:yes stop_codon:yes gene_type:complete
MYLFTSKDGNRPPYTGPNWFSPEPFYAIDVTVDSGGSVEFDGKTGGFPATLNALEQGKYFIQALFDFDIYHSDHAKGAGNLYSEVQEIEWTGENRLKFELTEVIGEFPFEKTEYRQQVRLYSPRLSAFYHREIVQKATVVLPRSYYEATHTRFPVIYTISGFGGTHETMGRSMSQGGPEAGEGEVEFIRVFLDGQCKWGHHVYADSAKNGPRGAALIKELIPEVDRRYRTVSASTARFVTGHSSGGWSSLWLQVNYPDVLGGVWSTAPDPVDFRDYQEVDLYAENPLSLYITPEGERRPLARRNGQVMIWYEDFGRMDDGLGRGGQLKSFEAVFSPLDRQGRPLLMWMRDEGEVIPSTVKYWIEYDINKLIERRWATGLSEKLAGKINVFMGTVDTFYLEGACEFLKKTMRDLDSDAVIELHPDRDHFNLTTPDLMLRIRKEMSTAYLKHHTVE